jgi:hypothetical protein
MHTLYALDLTGRPETDFLWRRTRAGLGPDAILHVPAARALDLPPDGFASPFGFWFAAAPSWNASLPQLRIEFAAPDDLERPDRRPEDPLERAATAGHAVRARLKPPGGRTRTARTTRSFSLEIDSSVARIKVDDQTWSSVGDTVLFAVAQYWRFAAIDRTLGELSHWARQDFEPGYRFWHEIRATRSRGLRARRRELQSLILDLPDFEGPLTNPRGHLRAPGAGRLYRRLVVLLGLGRYRREIDERIEVVETIFDSLAESLNHFQSLAFQIALELVIAALLLVDVGLYLFDSLAK